MVFLSNPWFIGIIGGIVSGLIVFYITTIVTKIYRRKEYSKIIISEYELQNEIRGEENLKFLPNRLEPLVISMLIILFSFVFVLLKFPEGSLLTLLSEKYKIVNISLATSTLVIGMLSFLTMIINTKDKKN